MPALNFAAQFADAVASGEKTQTIRRQCLVILESSKKPLTFRQLAREAQVPLHVVVAHALMIKKENP